MFGDRPDGVLDGRFAHRPQSLIALQRELIWNRLVGNYRMPKREYIFLYELRALERGNRWAPPLRPDIWERAKAMCCIRNVDAQVRRDARQSSEILDAVLQERKLAWLLEKRGMRPLIKVRRGKYHTLVYIVFCCLILDPNNHTMWKAGDLIVTPQHLALQGAGDRLTTYLEFSMAEKNRSFTQLVNLGLNMRHRGVYNKIRHIVKCSIYKNKVRALSIRYPRSARGHQGILQSISQYIAIWREEVREIMWLQPRQGQYAQLNANQFSNSFDEHFWFAVCFDPLCRTYQDAEFLDQNRGDEKLRLYRLFLQESIVIDGVHQAELDAAWEAANRVRRNRRRRRNHRRIEDEDESSDPSDHDDGNWSPNVDDDLGDDDWPGDDQGDARLGRRDPNDIGNMHSN